MDTRKHRAEPRYAGGLFLRLRGGDVHGDFEGLPGSQLAVFPGTTHFSGIARTDLVLDAVVPFLDA